MAKVGKVNLKERYISNVRERLYMYISILWWK